MLLYLGSPIRHIPKISHFFLICIATKKFIRQAKRSCSLALLFMNILLDVNRLARMPEYYYFTICFWNNFIFYQIEWNWGNGHKQYNEECVWHEARLGHHSHRRSVFNDDSLLCSLNIIRDKIAHLPIFLSSRKIFNKFPLQFPRAFHVNRYKKYFDILVSIYLSMHKELQIWKIKKIPQWYILATDDLEKKVKCTVSTFV